MNLSNLFFLSSLIFIFASGMYVGSVLQFNRDAGVLENYMENNTNFNPSCIPCECYTKFHPVLAEIPKAEPLVEKRMFMLPLDNLSHEKG